MGLEMNMVGFAVIFKGFVLTDSRMIALGSHLAESRENGEQSDKVTALGPGNVIYNESPGAYDMIANLCGHSKMTQVLTIFVDKIVQNLMRGGPTQQAGGK